MESKGKSGLINTQKILQKYLGKNNSNRDIYHDLMPFKVSEILLVSSLYDAFSIETDSLFSDQVFGEYHQLNLTSMPRITGATSYYDAFMQIEKRNFDLVITLMGEDAELSLQVVDRMKQEHPEVPVYLLLNSKERLKETQQKEYGQFDKIFTWNGASNIFFSMVKLLEDEKNLENDIKVGSVNYLLLVEDSPEQFSFFLPLLYRSIMEQTRSVIEHINRDELYKLLRIRVRPKILLAQDYESAVQILNTYPENVLCLLTDVAFPKEGELVDDAGLQLASEFSKKLSSLPVIIHSSDEENRNKAESKGWFFIHKNSQEIVAKLSHFLQQHLGFGNFAFTTTKGEVLGIAGSLTEFEKLLETISDESLAFHINNSDFSKWLMARGEVKIAKLISPMRKDDFNSIENLRKYLIHLVHNYRNAPNKGRIIGFDEHISPNSENIISLSRGSIGGKARGIAFVHSIINQLGSQDLVSNITLTAPITFFIGSHEYDRYIEKSRLKLGLYQDISDTEISYISQEATLSPEVLERLRWVVQQCDFPIAVRSSSLYEDSYQYPFSGIYETYVLPNNHADIEARLEQLHMVIRLIYASVFKKAARQYFDKVGLNPEQEKMGVVIQQMVGKQRDNLFYPQVSGVAQSYNYYPLKPLKAKDGLAAMAVGLGNYVVNGEKCWYFSPSRPQANMLTVSDMFKYSQTEFLAIDMNNTSPDFLKKGEHANIIRKDVFEAEKQGVLRHLASVYNPINHTILPGLNKQGPRVINFADILEYGYAPVAEALQISMQVFSEAVNAPVEIEFALELSTEIGKPAKLYPLQLKPYKPAIPSNTDMDVLLEESTLFLKSSQTMGEGLITDVMDILLVKPETFDKNHTTKIATEIGQINQKLHKEKKNYLLLGPGRWGTSDRFTGIPVEWSQISNAAMIVELVYDDFEYSASMGSHFFHNIASLNIGYSSLNPDKGDAVDLSLLDQMDLMEETKYIRHFRSATPLSILLNGVKNEGLITIPKDKYSQ